jgi:phenylalanyl-tRNA synthetase alpha chain
LVFSGLSGEKTLGLPAGQAAGISGAASEPPGLMQKVQEIDYLVLTGLHQEPNPVELAAFSHKIGLDQSKVSAVLFTRAGAEIEVEERPYVELSVGKKAQEWNGVLPERRIIEALAAAATPLTMPEIAERSGLENKDVGGTLKVLKDKAWAEQDGKSLRLTEVGQQAAQAGAMGPDEQIFAAVAKSERLLTDRELRDSLLPVEAGLKALQERKGILDIRERVERFAKLTDQGQKLVAAGIEPVREANLLTAEMIKDGSWKDVRFRPYDVTAAADPVHPGKAHPLVSVFEKTRRVFLEMGFEETESGYVESSFWDFDALFQPQDHPARDMQDTFYVGRPASCRLPDQALVKRVKDTHEGTGDCGSVGWRYKWSAELSEKAVLRTHTTASTVRALATGALSDGPTSGQKQGPRKVFCVGPVFRRETVDYKHLPVFHQVDGIIIDDKATFASLLGTLEAFYRKMGFSKFQFRPAFFPYTEPSVEIFVWSDKKSDWVEMGGAGMFRPEVTEPLGCTSPVLAWGLGLERLAMFTYDLSSIGELYRARLSWLKGVDLCRL